MSIISYQKEATVLLSTRGENVYEQLTVFFSMLPGSIKWSKKHVPSVTTIQHFLILNKILGAEFSDVTIENWGLSFGVYPRISLSFSKGMLSHVMRLDQLRAGKNIQ